MQGQLNLQTLQKTLNEIVRRHEVLRTAFKTINGQPVQAIASNLELKLAEIDLRSLPETERDREVERSITAETIFRFLRAIANFSELQTAIFERSLLSLAELSKK